jgi:hypothetical protein
MLQDAIAIDFDETFTANVNLWSNIIRMLQAAGHKVICATARVGTPGNRSGLAAVLPPGVKIVFCGSVPKRTACIAAGYEVKIWIDDCPEAIGDRGPGVLWLIRIESLLRGIVWWFKRRLGIYQR